MLRLRRRNNMPKTLKLRFRGNIPKYVEHERDGVCYATDEGTCLELDSFDAMSKWMAENQSDGTSVTAFWGCATCEYPVGGGGRLCDDCGAEMVSSSDQSAPEQK